jgi:predicted Zn-dependent peptidase
MDAAHDSLLRLEPGDAGDSAGAERLKARVAALEDSARTHVESNELDRILSREGARGLNATTTTESTLYYVQLPSNRAELWFALEADRMRNPVFREFYAERDVVVEERRMRVEDSPAGRLYETHLATAYLMHPYGVPVIGWMSDIERLSRAQVEEYYRRYYAPSNAVLAVVGSVDPEQIVEWAHEYLGGVPAGEPPQPVRILEPEQRGERRVQVEYDAEPLVRVGWHVPDITHPDMPALAVLSSLLTGGRTTRLYRRLVLGERAATAAFATLGPGQLHPQLFQIEAVPRAPHTPAEVERLIYEELGALADAPPTLDELQRVRNQMEAGEVRRLESNLGLAFQLADSETLFGDWRETFRLSRRLQDVEPEDVQRVVRRYFTVSNRTVATLVKPTAPAAGGPTP